MSEPTLTGRERQIAELVAKGFSNSEIARQLFLSRTTVASHVSRMLKRLGFKSRVQLAVWITEQRLRR